MQFESTRIYIRPIKIGDARALFAYRSDAETNRYQGWIPITLEDVENFIKRNPPTFNLPETWFQLFIINKEDKQVIGDIGVHFVGEENLQVELEITLNKTFHGNGYAYESLNLLISYLFNELGKHRITGSLDPRNIGSENLLKKLNFRKEAHFVKSYYQNGLWLDDVVYALLSDEWFSK